MTKPANTEVNPVQVDYDVQLVQAEVARRIREGRPDNVYKLTHRLWCTWLRRGLDSEVFS